MSTTTTTIGSLALSKCPAYPTIFWMERLNQIEVITADGGHAAYDSGPEILRGRIYLTNVSKTDAASIRDYITDTAIFGKNSFSIHPPDNTDLGAGAGIELTSCYWDGGNSLEDFFTFKAPGLYDIEFPYWRKTT